MFGFGKNDEKNNKKGTLFSEVAPKESNGYHCRSCKNCIESGSGSYSCHFGKPVLIVDNCFSTDDYFWCKGNGYESK